MINKLSIKEKKKTVNWNFYAAIYKVIIATLLEIKDVLMCNFN